jgi:4-hydroxy-2-oxoglutarate aldolase
MLKKLGVNSAKLGRKYILTSPPKLSGILPPVTTPFFDDHQVNFKVLHKNIAQLMKSPISGVVVLGSNGEYPSMSAHEQKDVLLEVSKQVESIKKDALLIAGTGGSCMKDVIHLAQFAADSDYDYALVSSPHYYKTSEQSLREYFLTIADALTDVIPVVLYNVPQFGNGTNLSSSFVTSLKHKNIHGIKDSSGNVAQFDQIVQNSTLNFSALSGNGSTIVSSLLGGGKGGIVALANIYPNEVVLMYSLFQKGDVHLAQKIQSGLVNINHACTVQYGIAGLKFIMKENGFEDQGPVRHPLSGLTEQDATTLKILNKKTKQFLNSIGVSNYQV